MAYPPCENPSCKSFGKPHPNCRCHNEMAQGGEAKAFCSQSNPHKKGCQYFAEGGTVDPLMQQAAPPLDPDHEAAGFLMEHGVSGLLDQKLLNDIPKYQASIKAGHGKLDQYVKSLFSNQKMSKRDLSSSSKTLDDWMEKGGLTADIQQALYDQNKPIQNFAEGGSVSKDPLHNAVAQDYPSQNLLLQVSKGRVSDYLNGQKPQKIVPKLAFDRDPDQTGQRKDYNKIKQLAMHPLGILEEIQSGTVSPSQMKHLSSMYPELVGSVQKKLTEEITKSQLDGKRPHARVRQGLSLFMGTPLSSEFKPQNILAAQATFTAQPASPNTSSQQGPTQASGKKPTGSKSALSKSDQSYLTSSQARDERQQSPH